MNQPSADPRTCARAPHAHARVRTARLVSEFSLRPEGPVVPAALGAARLPGWALAGPLAQAVPASVSDWQAAIVLTRADPATHLTVPRFTDGMFSSEFKLAPGPHSAVRSGSGPAKCDTGTTSDYTRMFWRRLYFTLTRS
jgi:hypothetical protein